MKTMRVAAIILAASLSIAAAENPSSAPSLGEKTSETLKNAGEKTKALGRDLADGTRKAQDALVDAVMPDRESKKIDVTITGRDIDMPKALEAGKTAFIVRNTDTEKHNFKIEGAGMEKQFILDVAPNDSKVLHMDLKPGSYKAFCPEKDHGLHGPALELTVK